LIDLSVDNGLSFSALFVSVMGRRLARLFSLTLPVRTYETEKMQCFSFAIVPPRSYKPIGTSLYA
jgi:hypothetical protein